MGRIVTILMSICVGSELLCSLVHQFILEAPYQKLFLISPLFFILAESVFCLLFTSHDLSAKFSKNYMIFRAGKLLATLALVIVMVLAAPQVGIGFFARIIVSYLILLAAETQIMVKASKAQQK